MKMKIKSFIKYIICKITCCNNTCMNIKEKEEETKEDYYIEISFVWRKVAISQKGCDFLK